MADDTTSIKISRDAALALADLLHTKVQWLACDGDYEEAYWLLMILARVEGAYRTGVPLTVNVRPPGE